MKKIVVRFQEGYFNAPGDRLEFMQDYSMLFAYREDALIGAFDMSIILDAHISDTAGEQNNNNNNILA